MITQSSITDNQISLNCFSTHLVMNITKTLTEIYVRDDDVEAVEQAALKRNRNMQP